MAGPLDSRRLLRVGLLMLAGLVHSACRDREVSVVSVGRHDPAERLSGEDDSSGNPTRIFEEHLLSGTIVDSSEYRKYLCDLVVSDPEEAIRRLRVFEGRLNDARRFERLISSLGRELLKVDFRISIHLGLELLEGKIQERYLSENAGQWIYLSDGKILEEAPQFLDEIPVGRSRNKIAGLLARGMASHDFEAAVRWTDGLSVGEAKEVYDQMAVGVTEENYEEVTTILPSIEDPVLRLSLEAALLELQLDQGLDQGFKWLREQGEEVGRDHQFTVLRDAARSNRADLALEYLSEHQSEYEDLYQAFAETHIHVDPISCVKWIDELEDKEFRQKLVGVASAAWAHDDAEGARNWAMALSEEPVRDLALYRVAREQIKVGALDSARTLVESISNTDYLNDLHERLNSGR